jgi:hypothetical protein
MGFKTALIAVVLFTASVSFAGPSGDLLRKVAADAKTEQEINSSHWSLQQKEARDLANTKAQFAIEIGDGASSYNAALEAEK